MESKILLESGTNELEVLEFFVGEHRFGINVAKVREIIAYAKPTIVPNSHPCVEGIYMPREEIVTIINLPKYLELGGTNEAEDKYVITNFNQLNLGFHVSRVEGIHRISWEDITKPDDTLTTENYGTATGIAKINGNLVIILDFEKIVAEISPATSFCSDEVSLINQDQREEYPIMIVEDSPLLFQRLRDCLVQAGYTNLHFANNGEEAWELLTKFKKEGTLKKNVTCIITDIEMPRMDGHYLTKLVKNDSECKGIPVIIFSSLVNEEMKQKGYAVGADAQISKPGISRLVDIIDGFVLAKRTEK